MNSQNKYGLTDFDWNNIISIIKSNPKIKKAILFGSRAKGTFHEGSDIDVALVGKELNLDTVLNLSIALDELNLAYKFDLILFDRIKEQQLIEHIQRVGVDLV